MSTVVVQWNVLLASLQPGLYLTSVMHEFCYLSVGPRPSCAIILRLDLSSYVNHSKCSPCFLHLHPNSRGKASFYNHHKVLLHRHAGYIYFVGSALSSAVLLCFWAKFGTFSASPDASSPAAPGFSIGSPVLGSLGNRTQDWDSIGNWMTIEDL